MAVRINFLPEFGNRAKAMAKRYKSFKSDYDAFLRSLEQNPTMGTSLGASVYKVRMAIASKGKGKSGGARVLTYKVSKTPTEDICITLLTIFDKSDIANVSDKYIKCLVAQINQ